MSRNLVFISHANPEDNDVVIWLASRLHSLGYLVWSDITKLFGAEIFWDAIEDAIRNHAAKVIVIVSELSQRKEGVQDEVNLAISIERSEKRPRFVVPIRIDDIDFLEIRLNISRKNIIDFKNCWVDGFKKLIKVLERDSVPKSSSLSIEQSSSWLCALMHGEQQVVKKNQLIVSNWFDFKNLPETINFFRIPISESQFSEKFKDFQWSWFNFQDMIASFCCKSDIDDYLPQWQKSTIAHRIQLKSYLYESDNAISNLDWLTARRHLIYLIKDSWNKSMQERELLSYDFADGSIAWYYPHDRFSGDRVKYIDIDNKERYRKLVGCSRTLGVYWHFAVDVRPFLGKLDYISLKPRVVFTVDGINPIDSSDRMHSLRRGFCRNWWNARWRDLIIAYITQLSNNRIIELPTGNNTAIRINAEPMSFNLPVSISNLTVSNVIDDESDEDLDHNISVEDLEILEEFEDDEDFM